VHPQSPALRALAEKWDAVPAAERANFQSYATELCEALGVERPQPRGSGYEFEYPATTTDRKSGTDTTSYIDLYRQGHFILVAQQTERAQAAKDQSAGRAYGKARWYARAVPDGPPPFLMVMEVGRMLLLWDRWRGDYSRFTAARRFDLRALWDHGHDIEFLRAVWKDPESLDPNAGLRRIMPGVEITVGPCGYEIVLPVAPAAIAALLQAMLESNTEFRFFDPLYPSMSDPGAYVSYSPGKGAWRMTMGNHGWSGGIYEIQAQVVCNQLHSLRARGLLKTIDLEQVYFGSHDAPESLSTNEEMNRRLLEIHR
jgi:hypothetical protein